MLLFESRFDLMTRAYMNEHALVFSDALNQGGLVVRALQEFERERPKIRM